MKLFVNDIPVEIKKMEKDFRQEDFNIIINGRADEGLLPIKFTGHVLVWDCSIDQIDKIFQKMRDKKLKKLQSITFAVDDQDSVVHFVKEQFKVIKAAG